MRILFLCNNYSSLSIACLCALHGVRRHHVSVGLLHRRKGRIRSLLLNSLRRYGPAETLRRGIYFLISGARFNVRRLGVSLKDYSTVGEFLQVHNYDRFYLEDFNSRDAIRVFRELRFDLFVAGSFGQILSRDMLAVPRLGVLNVHLSMLPKYRGPSPCYWVVRNKERKTGVTVHFMDERIDSGDIALQREVPVLPGESAAQLERRLTPIGGKILLEVIGQLEAGTVKRVSQSGQDASYYSFPARSPQMARFLRISRG